METATDPANETERISDAFLTARATHSVLPEFPGNLPADMDAAYEIQNRSLKIWPQELVGWKVGGVPPHLRAVLKQDRVVGPAFENRLVRADSETAQMPVFEGGFAAVEPEFVLELGGVVALTGEALSAEDVLPCIQACYIGCEIASSPLPIINKIGSLAVASDFGNNNGIIQGKRLEAWSPEYLSEMTVETEINGKVVGTANAPEFPDGPLAAVAFLINNLRRRGLHVPDGLLVATGAITGIHDVVIGDTSKIRFDGLGEINIEIVKSTD